MAAAGNSAVVRAVPGEARGFRRRTAEPEPFGGDGAIYWNRKRFEACYATIEETQSKSGYGRGGCLKETEMK